MIMEELLQRLEKQIKKLIDERSQLALSNQELNQGTVELAQEKTVLLEKQQRAISQIEALISRLKTIESMS